MLLKARLAIREAQKKKRIVSREGLVGFMMGWRIYLTVWIGLT